MSQVANVSLMTMADGYVIFVDLVSHNVCLIYECATKCVTLDSLRTCNLIKMNDATQVAVAVKTLKGKLHFTSHFSTTLHKYKVDIFRYKYINMYIEVSYYTIKQLKYCFIIFTFRN